MEKNIVINREMEKRIQKDMANRVNNIPEQFIRSFTKRALNDAEKIVSRDNEKFDDVAYAIYRGYCIGFVFGNIKKNDN